MDQYITTYQNDYLRRDIKCPVRGHRMRIEANIELEKVECQPRVYTGEAGSRPYENRPLPSCPCGAGGTLPKRGVDPGRLPLRQDNESTPQSGGRLPQQFTKEQLAEMMFKAAETDNVKDNIKPTKFRPVPVGKYGGQFEGPANVPEFQDKPCRCPPPKPESGPQDYGPAWIRDRALETRLPEGPDTSDDIAKFVFPEPPAARVSCAPEAEESRYDQPNTFMKKLYEKYPYLYQILRNTPPEELVSRVFKDRFLSTYQVDYLRMGVGKVPEFQSGGPPQEKFVSPEGEPEPEILPGCTFRASKKGEFGLKKSTLKKKTVEDSWGEEEESEDQDKLKEEPRISEYMASISKLGGEIISDQLYNLEAKNRKKAAIKAARSW